MPTVSGHTIEVAANGDLQAAINAASPGDQIILPAGATFTGNYTLPAKNGTSWIVIRSAGSLPVQGSRVHPSDASQMAKIVAANPTMPVIRTLPGAQHYRLIGLEVTTQASATSAYSLVALGDGSNAQVTPSLIPQDLVLDRMYVHGTTTLDLQRCVALNSGSTAIVDSYLSECHAKQMDSQAIAAWNGPGPYRIENNYLEGSGENMSFGGADPSIAGQLPRDIVIRRNYFYKPMSWKGVWQVKNLIEFKFGQRILIDSNVFENCWQDAQEGSALVFKSVNQNQTAPWSQTSDVTVQNNIIRNSDDGVSLSANPVDNPGTVRAIAAARIRLTNNVFDKIGVRGYPGGRLFLIAGIQGLTIDHNTGLTGDYGMVLTDQPVSSLVIQDNIFGSGSHWIGGRDVAYGTASLAAFTSSAYVFAHNVLVGADSSTYPANNYYPAQVSSLGLASDLSLPRGSQYLTTSTTGGAIGANVAGVLGATSGVTN